MGDQVPGFDAVPLGAPGSKAPLPPEINVDRFDDGVVLCELPTPYRMGWTNCWLFVGDDDVLCVDPGTDPDLAAEHIGAALAPHGRGLDDIETILVTHTHPDHCAAAAGLAERTDAKVAIGAPEIDLITGHPGSPAPVIAAWQGLGAPPEEVRRAARRKLPYSPVPVDRIHPLPDGGQLQAGGRRWQVHLVAGHSPGHAVLVADDIVIAGDQLLANVLPAVHFGPPVRTSNGEPPVPGRSPWAPSVADFLGSMIRFDEGFDAMTVLPGHGPAFQGTARPIERARRYHRVRCELVAAQLSKRGSTTVWDLAVGMYAGLVSSDGVDRRFASAAAEVAGRLEALHYAGRATRTSRNGVVLFAPAF